MKVDVDAASVDAFGLADELPPRVGEPHAHRYHQLLYAAEGALRLETKGTAWLLPPQRAAFIAAGVTHRVTTTQRVSLRTVYLAEPLATRPEAPFADCCVFAATPLAREMILYAMRWPHDRAADDRVASRFFAALGALVGEWASSPHPFHLPVARSPELEKATAFVWEHLGEPLGVERVAKAAATSVRTLARRFESELSLSFRAYLGAARMLYAMDRLAQRDARVTDIALEVGFASPSAFTAAFTEFVGEPPTAYRARLGP